MPEPSAIGRSIPRVDGGEKVTGLTRFAGDVRLPGLLHVRLVLSPHAHARILKINGKQAAELPGVVRVFTGRDLPLPDRKSTRLNSSHIQKSRMPSSA